MIPVFGEWQRAPNPGRVRLVHADLFGPELGQSFDAVRRRTFLEAREAAQLRFVERHHELAAVLERDVMLGREFLDGGLALAAESRLQRARRVVEAGMELAAVVPALMGRELGFAFPDHDAKVREAAQQLQ